MRACFPGTPNHTICTRIRPDRLKCTEGYPSIYRICFIV
nr:MAG TPA: hypothetical protein [Caudoviricetes sp.]